MTAIIPFTDLQAMSGYQRKSDVIRWAERQGIRFKYSRDGIWTTPDALNAALGLQSAKAEQYETNII